MHPFEARLAEAERAASLQPQHGALSISGKDALEEQLTFFVLGGLSSLAAEIAVLEATNAWAARDWSHAEQCWQTVTTLNPRRPNYWISAARDMSVNASSFAFNNTQLDERERISLSKAYFDRGVKFLEEGIAHHPNTALLFCSLGDTLSDLNRFPSFTRAVAAYHSANRLGAPSIYKRQEFYNLCRIRGREQEAWEMGRTLYDTPSQRVPSLLCLLFVLQNKLNIPPTRRLTPKQLFGTEEKARRELTRFLKNSLRFPVTGIREQLQSPQFDHGFSWMDARMKERTRSTSRASAMKNAALSIQCDVL